MCLDDLQLSSDNLQRKIGARFFLESVSEQRPPTLPVKQQSMAIMILGYLYIVGSEEMDIKVDYNRAEQVRRTKPALCRAAPRE